MFSYNDEIFKGEIIKLVSKSFSLELIESNILNDLAPFEEYQIIPR